MHPLNYAPDATRQQRQTIPVRKPDGSWWLWKLQRRHKKNQVGADSTRAKNSKYCTPVVAYVEAPKFG